MIALLFVLLAQVAAPEPTDAAGWFKEGVRRHDARDFKGAVAAYEHAAAMKYPQRVPLSLRRARALAQSGDKENALAMLEQLASGGFAGVEQLLGENELFPVRSDERWAKIVATIRANAHPCRSAPEYRQFDYWLGEWDVEVSGAPGASTSTSSIQLILDQCVVFENYTAGNYTGKSFSSWVAADKEWKQHYVDSGGTSSDWSGHLDNGRMVFLSRGAGGLQRMTYSKEGPDRVRQFIEASSDDGKTWSPTFDGMYVRRK
jgi:hypothetical protein